MEITVVAVKNDKLCGDCNGLRREEQGRKWTEVPREGANTKDEEAGEFWREELEEAIMKSFVEIGSEALVVQQTGGRTRLSRWRLPALFMARS